MSPASKRDSLFGEPVLWSGRPKAIVVPGLYRGAAIVCGVTSAIATTSAIVVATALAAPPGGLLAFAAWMATLAFALSFLPKWWLSALEFQVTDRHIIVRRGKFRRFIDRRAVSFARIRWHKRLSGIGDLELVRAVPTGALRRRLTILMHGLVAPDRVWAIIRGVTPSAPAGDGQRLLAQRLDDGERVLWSSHPEATWRAWVPSGGRAVGSIGIALGLGGAAAVTAQHAVHALRKVAIAIDPETPTFIALAASMSIAIVLLASGALAILYAVVVRPARLLHATRYLITDRRVLIQQGDEELHLDRSHIVDLIDAPSIGGMRDVFLVLDGPHARALAAGGAFGEAHAQGLQPVLRQVEDVETVRSILFEAGVFQTPVS